MKAIIEIPDEIIRSAGSAIAMSRPHFTDLVIAAMQRLGQKEEIALRFDKEEFQTSIIADTAMLCVTQVMEDIMET